MAFKKGAAPATNGDSERPNAILATRKLMESLALLEDGESKPGNNQERMFIAMGEATTLEELWDADEKDSIGGRDLVNFPQRILGFTVTKSAGPGPKGNIFRTAEGEGMYLNVLTVALADFPKFELTKGTEFEWNTSAPAIVGKLLNMQRLGAFPVECQIIGIETANGTTIKLKPLTHVSTVPGSTVSDEAPF